MSYTLPQNDFSQAGTKCAVREVVQLSIQLVNLLVLVVVLLVIITSFGTA